MKKKKFLVYLTSGLVPLMIFLLAALVNGYVPFGNFSLNVYDSFSQYSSFILGLKDAIMHGNIFYSWACGLGFNFFGSLAYYLLSPLNLLCIFANQVNYPYFIGILTYVRIALLGLSMCFYLERRDTSFANTVLFSTLFALCGYTSTYYYNFMWIDAIICLPFVIHGLDKLIDKSKPLFYIVSLTICICINFYIGYMICIFCLLYFIYKMIIKYDKKAVKCFIISSLLAGVLSCVILLPTFFALASGKASLYSSVDYSGISNNSYLVFVKMLSGNYERGDQSALGPALVYSGIISLVLVIFTFFNKDISKREKRANAFMLTVFYLSFGINAINYVWQMFQHPIWWESRFSFLFSFFMIITAVKSLEKVDKVDIKLSKRLIVGLIFIILFIVGIIFKVTPIGDRNLFIYIFLGFSILVFIEMLFLADKKMFFPLLFIFSILDVSINTYNSLKQNNIKQNVMFYSSLKQELSGKIDELNELNNGEFYRMELVDDYTSDDGMYFSYNGINYFNSVRNIKPIKLLKYLGVPISDDCHVQMKTFDPLFTSLFNIKYIYGDVDYFKKEGTFYVNEYPLSIGFRSDKSIKDVKLIENEYSKSANISKIINGIMGYDVDIYKHFSILDAKYINIEETESNLYTKDKAQDAFIEYEFVSDGKYLLMPVDEYAHIKINDYEDGFKYYVINKGDKVSVSYQVFGKAKKDLIYLDLLDLDKYEDIMKQISQNVMHAQAYKDGHILSGYYDFQEDGYLFTSIPYEEGMKVYVDGVEKDIIITMDALVSIEAESGHHEVYIDYVPKGLKAGLIMSTCGLVLTVIYLQKHKKTI